MEVSLIVKRRKGCLIFWQMLDLFLAKAILRGISYQLRFFRVRFCVQNANAMSNAEV